MSNTPRRASWHRVCQDPSQTEGRAWCDPSQNLDERVAALVAALTTSEKASLLSDESPGVARLGIPKYGWWTEGLHGVARSGLATSFPQIIGVAASWNRSLFRQLGKLVGTEARGKHNRLDGLKNHGLTIWSPNVNIFRDPRWGRGQETPGEDPLLNGHYAEDFVSGLQGNERRHGYLLTSAALKHFAAHSMETNRTSFSAVVTAQDMEDTYLPAFEAGVARGKASGIMCAYNSVTYGSGIFGPGRAAQQHPLAQPLAMLQETHKAGPEAHPLR